MIDVDRRLLALAISRAIETFSVSFLIIVLPLFIAGDSIPLEYLLSFNILGFEPTTEFYIGIALSVSLIVSSIGQPLFGRITDKIGERRRMILLGLAILAVSTPFYLIITSYTQLLTIRFIQGVAGAILIPAAVALVNDYAMEQDGNRGELFGYYNTFRLLGLAIGPLFAGYIISNGPYNILSNYISGIDMAFYATVVLVTISLLFVYILVEEPDFKDNNSDSDINYKNILLSDEFKIVLILSFATFWLATSINMFSTLEVEVNDRFGQTATWFGIQFSAALLANVIGQIPIGRASDIYRKKPFLIIGFIILTPAVALQGFAVTSIQMTILRGIQGIAVAMVFIPTLSYIGEIAGSDKGGFYLSFATASFALGLALGPTASGILFSIGGFTLPFLVAGFFSFIGLVLVLAFLPKKT